MTGEIELITYEHGGFPVELLDERDWRRAIRAHRLRRRSEVLVRRKGELPRRQAAEEVELLRVLFDELDPQPASAPAPAPAPVAAGAEHREEAARYEDAAADWEQEYIPASSDEGRGADFLGPEPEPLAPPFRREPGGAALLAVLAAFALVFVFVWIAAVSGGGEGNEVASRETAYLVAESANVRDRPTVQGSQVIATLPRGTPVYGTVVEDGPGEDWIRIGSGTYAGHYVWTGNLEAAGTQVPR